MEQRNPKHRRGSGSFLMIMIAFLLTFPIGAVGQSVLLADAHTSSTSANGNFGANPALSVSTTNAAYVKFDISRAYPAGTLAEDISGATVKLYVSKVSTAGKLDLFPVLEAWDEKSISYNNAPPVGPPAATTRQIVKDDQGDYVLIDITDLMKRWLGDGQNALPNHGFVLAVHPVDAETPQLADITFDSKENSQTSHDALLSVQLNRPPDSLTTVAHDATLIGDGTVANPLGIAPGTINSTHLVNNAVSSDKIVDGAITSAKISAPLSLTSVDPAFTFRAINTGTGAAIAATGAVDITNEYRVRGLRSIFQSEFLGTISIGPLSGQNLGGSFDSTFVGQGAGNKTTSGSSNTFVGSAAGAGNTTGFFNSFFGSGAGSRNITGAINSFFGNEAGSHNTTGCCNNFFGSEAGQLNTTGRNNSFFGGIAGRSNTTGSFNLFFGDASGISNISGNRNVFIGASTGTNNTTGSFNTLIGSNSHVGTSDLTYATAIGSDARVNTSNTIVLGRILGQDIVRIPGSMLTNGNLAIGNQDPRTKLHITGGKIYVESSGQGVILKSSNGSCFELTVLDTGALSTVAVSCP